MEADHSAPWRGISPANPIQGVARVTGVAGCNKVNVCAAFRVFGSATQLVDARCNRCNKALFDTPATPFEECGCNKDVTLKGNNGVGSEAVLHPLHLLHPNKHGSYDSEGRPPKGGV